MNEALVTALHATPAPPHLVMSCEQSSISNSMSSSDRDVRNIERQTTSLKQLPNELLTAIVELVGRRLRLVVRLGWATR